MPDKPCQSVENIVAGTDDWYVTLGSIKSFNQCDILLPTCLSAMRWLAIGRVRRTKFAIHKVALDLAKSFRIRFCVSTIQPTSSSGCVIGSQSEQAPYG